MAVSVGGVTIGLGVSLDSVMSGLKEASGAIVKFERDLKNIRLEAAIQGDPFSGTRKYLKSSKDILKDVFDGWKKNIKYATDNFDHLTNKVKDNAKDILATWQTLNNKMKILQQHQFLGGQARLVRATKAEGIPGKENAFYSTTTDYMGIKSRGLNVVGEAFVKNIEKMRGYSTELDTVIKELNTKLLANEEVPATEIAKMIDKMRLAIYKEGKGVIAEYEKLGAKLERGFKLQPIAEYAAKISKAGSSTEIYKDRLKTLQNIRIEEVRLRKEIGLGINAESNRARVMQILQQRQNLGIRLTEKSRIELKAYNREMELAATRRSSKDLFSPEWFRTRARWFVELRMLWGAYRAVGDAVRSVVDYQVQLSRAMRTADSAIMSHTETMKQYSMAMSEAIIKHAADWKDVGEVLYQLGSAGLSAEESLAGLNAVMTLIVGTEGDARETTKAVAGIYNNFKDTLDRVGGSEEKLIYITDLAASAWRRHQVEINELADGYKRSSAMAKLAGVSIEDLTALLSVANDHMIKGGQAGRALTNVFSRIARTPRAFAEAFGIKIKGTEKLDFMTMMGDIAKRFGKGIMSVAELGAAFERLGLRGAPLFATLIQNWEEVIKAQEDYMDVSGVAAEVEKTRLDNAEGQWKRLIAGLKSYAAQAEGILDHLTVALSFYVEALEKINKIRGTQYAVAGLYDVTGELDPKKVKELSDMTIKRIKEEQERMKKLREEYSKSTFGRMMGTDAALTAEIQRYGTILDMTGDKLKEYEENIKKTKEAVEALAEAEGIILGTAEQKFYWWYRGDKSRREQLKHLETQLKLQKKTIRTTEEEAKGLKEGPGRADIFTSLNEMKEKQKAIEGEIKKIRDEERKEQSIILNLQKDSLEADIKSGEAKKKELDRMGVTKEEHSKLLELVNEELHLKEQIAGLELRMALIKAQESKNSKEEAEAAKKKYEQTIKQLEAERKTEIGDIDIKALRERQRVTTQTLDEELDAQKQKLELAKIEHKPKAEILKIERETLHLQLDSVEASIKEQESLKPGVERTRAIASLEKKRREYHLELLGLMEKEGRQSSIMYDFSQKLKDQAVEFHDLIVDSMMTFATGTAKGVGSTMSDITGGFQEQKQEVINLREQLRQLGVDYNDAITEGDAEKAKHIAEQMERLKENISDGEN